MFRPIQKLIFAVKNWRYFGIFTCKECNLVAYALRTLPHTWKLGDPSWVVVSKAPDLAFLAKSDEVDPSLNVSDSSSCLSVVNVKEIGSIWEWFGIPSALKGCPYPRNIESAEKNRTVTVDSHDLYKPKRICRLDNSVSIVVK
jgi:hypothetical protein